MIEPLNKYATKIDHLQATSHNQTRLNAEFANLIATYNIAKVYVDDKQTDKKTHYF